jgi:hypothetical protein
LAKSPRPVELDVDLSGVDVGDVAADVGSAGLLVHASVMATTCTPLRITKSKAARCVGRSRWAQSPWPASASA